MCDFFRNNRKKAHDRVRNGIRLQADLAQGRGVGVRLDGAGSSAVFLTGLSAFSQALGFFYRVGLSRLVGAQVMGLYQLVMPVYAVLMSLTASGLTAAVSTLSARYLALNNSRAAAQTVRRSLVLFGGLLVPLGALTVLLCDPVSVYLLGDARTQLGLVLLVPCVALTGVENIHKHFFYGTGRVRAPAVVEVMEQLIRTGAVLGLLLVLRPGDPESAVGLIVVGMIVCEVFSSAVLVGLYRHRMARLGEKGPGERSGRLYGRMVSMAAPVALTALLGNLMNAINSAMVPQKLVASGLDRGEAMAAVGVVCGMTVPMLSTPMLFLGAINLIMVPRVAHYCALGRMERACGAIRRALECVCALILPCMTLLSVVGGRLGRLLFGQEHMDRYLMPLAVGLVCSAVHCVLSGALNGMERQGVSAGIALVCDVVQMALTAVLMGRPGGGMGGYVAGMTAASVLGAVLALVAVCRFAGLRLSLWRTAGGALLASALCGQTARLLPGILDRAGASEGAVITLTMGLGLAVYIGAMCAMGLENVIFPFRRKNAVDKTK